MSIKVKIHFTILTLLLGYIFSNVYFFASEQDKQVTDCCSVTYREFCEKCNFDIKALEQLIKENPDNIEYKVWLGNLYINVYRFSEAIDLANEVIGKSSSCGLAYALLALAKIQDERFSNDTIGYIDCPEHEIIQEHLNKAMAFSPNDMLPKVLDCYIEAWLGNREKALQTIDNYLSKEPESIDAWFWKGNIFFDRREDDWDLIRALKCYLHPIGSRHPEVKKQLGIWAREQVNEAFWEKINNIVLLY